MAKFTAAADTRIEQLEERVKLLESMMFSNVKKKVQLGVTEKSVVVKPTVFDEKEADFVNISEQLVAARSKMAVGEGYTKIKNALTGHVIKIGWHYKDQSNALARVVTDLGGTVVAELSRKVTHYVTTKKYEADLETVSALQKGCQIVHPAWIYNLRDCCHGWKYLDTGSQVSNVISQTLDTSSTTFNVSSRPYYVSSQTLDDSQRLDVGSRSFDSNRKTFDSNRNTFDSNSKTCDASIQTFDDRNRTFDASTQTLEASSRKHQSFLMGVEVMGERHVRGCGKSYFCYMSDKAISRVLGTYLGW